MIATLGVFILLLAFALNLLNTLSVDGWLYPGLNFAGAAISAYASWLILFYPFVLLEGIWTLVSLVTLLIYGRRRLWARSPDA